MVAPRPISERIEQLRRQIASHVHAPVAPAAGSPESEAEHRWREQQIIFDSVPAMIWFKDADNRFLRVNKAAAESLGLSSAELVGRSCYDLYPDDAARYHLSDLEVIASGNSQSGILEPLVVRSGEKRWIRTDKIPYRDETGAIVGVIVFGVDVTERVLAEHALQMSEQRFRSFFESAPDAIFVEDVNGVVLDANPTACRLYGLSIDELRSRNAFDLVDPETRPALERDFGKLLSGESKTMQGLSYGVRGANTALELSGTRIEYQGKPALLLQVRDITERKRFEDALQESNRRLEEALERLEQTQLHSLQQARLHALGHMASGVAHDFNNTLSPIVGFSELLLNHPEYLEDDEKARRYLSMIKSAALDAANVVRGLREFYRPRDADEAVQMLDLNRLVMDTLALTQPRWKNQAQAAGISIHVATTLAATTRVRGNEAELREALMNLIFNSLDAMPAGGSLSISTRSETDKTLLEVRDTGIGMTEEERVRCLEPFFSTKGERGTGLGLAMVYGILRRHEAGIEISSTVGLGTTCTLCFPASRALPAPATAPLAPASSDSLAILIVEDEPLLREVLTEYLSDDGHRVTTAVDGLDGLEKWGDGSWDLIITDRAMPGMSGDQLALELKARAPQTPIILLTGFGELMRAAGETAPGVDRILSKPLTFDALREAIAAVVARARDLNGPT